MDHFDLRHDLLRYFNFRFTCPDDHESLPRTVYVVHIRRSWVSCWIYGWDRRGSRERKWIPHLCKQFAVANVAPAKVLGLYDCPSSKYDVFVANSLRYVIMPSEKILEATDLVIRLGEIDQHWMVVGVVSLCVVPNTVTFESIGVLVN